MPDEMEIAQIIQKKFLDDDPDALEMVYEHFAKRLYGYLVSMVKSPSDAEEILNELFMTIVRKREQVAKASNIRTYLFAIARNLAYEMFRKRTSQKAVMPDCDLTFQGFRLIPSPYVLKCRRTHFRNMKRWYYSG